LSDKSVSRLHAELEVVHAKENLALPERQPQVSITDKSRFGTLHNGTKLAAGEPTRLAAGDELKFGVNQDAYRLAFVPLVAYWGARNAGVLSREEQALILKSLHKLGTNRTRTTARTTARTHGKLDADDWLVRARRACGVRPGGCDGERDEGGQRVARCQRPALAFAGARAAHHHPGLPPGHRRPPGALHAPSVRHRVHLFRRSHSTEILSTTALHY
jgi:hypothetical protein